MRPTLSIISMAALGLLAVACEQSSDSEVVNQLKDMNKRLKSMEAKLDKVGTGGPAVAGGRGAAGGPPGAPGQQPQGRPPGPDPAEVYSVPIDGGAWKGARDAKITIVKAYEYACPYCDKVRPTIDQLLEDYKGDVKVVSKMLIVHPQVATIPAQAVCAANLQGKFAQMDDLVWEKGFRANRNLGQDNMEKIAAEVGLNMDQFKKDMAGSCVQLVNKDQAELRKVGAGGTPAFFINGRFLSGARPIEHFRQLIDEELKKANERIGKGTKVQDYYSEWVLKKGKPSV